MLKKLFRFHGQRGVRRVYKQGRMARSQHFAVKTIINDNRKNSRVTVVVSKKVSKKAVVRNRIRRRVYEIMRINWQEIKPGADIVVTVFSEQVAIQKAAELNLEIMQLLKKAGCLR